MWRPLRKTPTIVYVSSDSSDGTTLFAEHFSARAGDPFDISLDLGKNLRTRNRGEDTVLDALKLTDGGIATLKTVQIDDQQVLDGLRRKLKFLPEQPKQFRLRVQLEGDHWFVVKPEVPAGGGDTLLLHVVSVLPGPVPEQPAVRSAVVVVPFTCTQCDAQLEVDCQHTKGFSVMSFYRVDCPKCGKDGHRQLPGNIVDVRVAGEEGDE